MKFPAAASTATARANAWYLLLLLLVIVAGTTNVARYAVFDGFTSFSNDSFHYVLMARKWSPWFEASTAESLSLPEQVLPPAFSWILSVSGASESTYYAHVLVLSFLVAGIALAGWFTYLKAGPTYALFLTVTMFLLPGTLISSLGILSENTFLLFSIASLLLYGNISDGPRSGWGWYVALFLCVSATLLTRSVGLALAIAFLVVGLVNRKLSRRQRMGLVIISIASIVASQAWEISGQQEMRQLSYTTIFLSIAGDGGMLTLSSLPKLFFIIKTNAMAFVSSWAQYLNLSQAGFLTFLSAYALLGVSLFATVRRFVQLEPDAVYLVFYLLIILAWPWTGEILRFLHPIVFLVLLQPILLAHDQEKFSLDGLAGLAGPALIVLAIWNSIVIQASLHELRNSARVSAPQLAHSYEYYAGLGGAAATNTARQFQSIMQMMEDSAERIPEGSKVATVKPMAFTLLSNRRAVMLSAKFSYHQQLCNLEIEGVDFVFISPLTATYNIRGLELLDEYREFSSASWTSEAGEVTAHLLQIDRKAVRSILDESGFECREFRALM